MNHDRLYNSSHELGRTGQGQCGAFDFLLLMSIVQVFQMIGLDKFWHGSISLLEEQKHLYTFVDADLAATRDNEANAG
ncbi:MAG: hypothetical protein DRI77_10995 [Chloroflexi bacterium]|nr:MAG: hypothetical protein DRI77_10995 [Chloroflexota bacterium]